jgi:aminoethylphosphonate catabolism LysR family transcriptional regulator
MNITLLRAFHHVAQAGGFTRAAQATGMSQPTLSSQVRQLEAAHDVSLFDRKGRGAVLTPMGQRLYDLTTRLFAAADEAGALLEGARTLRRGHLRIAADSATHVMPILAALRARHAGLTFSLGIGNSSDVLEQLLGYGVDIAVTARATSDPRIHAVLLKRDRLVLFAPRQHPLATGHALELAALEGRDLVLRERGSITREVFEARLAEQGIKPGTLMEVQSREAVREAVVAGFGLGVVFESELGQDAGLMRIDVTGADLTVEEYVACLETRRRLPLVRGFFDSIPKITN